MDTTLANEMGRRVLNEGEGRGRRGDWLISSVEVTTGGKRDPPIPSYDRYTNLARHFLTS